MMIEGWGVAVDRVISDFLQGTVEWLVEQGEERGDWIFVEGQGSLDHPAYSSVTLGLIHGATPAGHGHGPQAGPRRARLRPPARAGRSRSRRCPGSSGSTSRSPASSRRRGSWPSRSTRRLLPDEAAARRAIAETAELTGLPTDDPFRFGGTDSVRRDPINAGGHAMKLTLTHEVHRIAFRDPFRIARTLDPVESDGMTSVIVDLKSGVAPGIAAVGEGYPDTYYGETEATMTAVLPRLLAAVEPLEERLAGPATSLDEARTALIDASNAMDAAIRHHGAAKCALDIALHDLVGKRFGLPVHELLGLSAVIPPTDFTIGLDEPAVVAERASRASRFPALKIKLGGPVDLETLDAVRGVYDGPIRVDANTGWTLDQAKRSCPT